MVSKPVPGPFVGNCVAPSASSGGTSGGIASVNDGTGASDAHHAGPVDESSLQRDHHVPDHFDRSGSQFRENASDFTRDLGPRGASGADADVLDLIWSNLR